MKKFKKIVTLVLMFSFIGLNSSALIPVLATQKAEASITVVKVTIAKYLDNTPATAVNANSLSFSMHAITTINNNVFPGDYDLGPSGFNGNPNPYQGDTNAYILGTSYSTYENINQNVGESCNSNTPYSLVGYTTSDISLEDAASKTPTLDVPNFNNLQSNQYVIVWNHKCEGVAIPQNGKVHIFKFIDGQQATVQNANGVTFPMITATYGNATYPLKPGGYTGGDADYEASTNEINGGGSYTTNEDTSTSLVGTDCKNDNNPTYELTGYSSGDTLDAAKNAVKSLTPPNVTVNGDKYIIVWNHDCSTPVNSATIVATKVVCDNEANLPNYGHLDSFYTGPNAPDITATTAEDWVATHNSCHIDPNWKFQWGLGDNPGDMVGEAPTWTTFGPANVGNTSVTNISLEGITTPIHVREVFKDGYLPFSHSAHPDDSDHVSAEFYCDNDVIYYDNYDWIWNPQAGHTYNCVGWNVPLAQEDNVATIAATKVVCDNEADLPNYGHLDSFYTGPNAPDINATTAEDWVATHPNTCHIDKDWKFQWGLGDNPGDMVGEAPTWTTFGPANVGDKAVTTIPLAGITTPIHVREVMKDGYIPFSYTAHPDNTDHVSAEFYCDNDVIYYDNYDWIWAPQPGHTYNCVGWNVPTTVTPPPAATVTLCKADDHQNPLPNWTLMLRGDKVEDLNVPTNTSTGIDTSVPLVAGASYIAKSVGTWLNQGGVNPVDTEYSTTDGWVTHMDGYTGYSSDILELQIDSKFDPNSNWGVYNSLHTYAQSFIPTGTSSNFRIFDGTGTDQNLGWFTDNSGSLAVSIYKGFSGITDESGCITFKDVPYGTYNTDEIMKDGWSNVSGLDQVVVDQPTETFTVVNHDNSVLPSTVKVTIEKYIQGGAEVTVPATAGNTDSTSFPMHAVYPGGEGDYALGPVGFNNPNPYQATTADMPVGSNYSTSENLGTECTPQNQNQYVLVGYKVGDSEAAALASAIIPVVSFTNLQSDKFVIVINKKCGEVQGATTLKVHVYKYLSNNYGISQVGDESGAPEFPMTATWQTANLSGGVSTSSNYVLGNNHGSAALKYAADTAPMEAPADYTTSEITDGSVVVPTDSNSCPEGKYKLLGYKSSTVDFAGALSASLSTTAPIFTGLGADAYVIVVNEKCPDVIPPTTARITIIKNSVNGDGTFHFTGLGDGNSFDLTTVQGTASSFFDVFADANGESYTITESPSEGWTFVGSSCTYDNNSTGVQNNTGETVTVHPGDEVTCTFTNAIRVPQPLPTGSIEITKYVCPQGTTVVRSQNGVGGTVPQGCTLQSGKTFGYVHGSQTDANDPYPELDGPFTEAGSTSGNGALLINNLPATGRYLVIETDGQGHQLQAGDILGLYCQGDGDTSDNNDNQELTFVTSEGTVHCVAYNKAPVDTNPVDNNKPECSDGIDNDLTGGIDSNDVNCHEGNDPQGAYNLLDNNEGNDVTPVINNNSGGSGGHGGGFLKTVAPQGQVLGATTTCGIYVDKFLRKGYKNDIDAVKKVQKFLNEYMKAGLPENGIFGPNTEKALKKFQLGHRNKVLDPWGLKVPTGIFYLTTQTEVNNIMCPELNLPIPPLTPMEINPLAPKKD